eukprot:112031_1
MELIQLNHIQSIHNRIMLHAPTPTSIPATHVAFITLIPATPTSTPATPRNHELFMRNLNISVQQLELQILKLILCIIIFWLLFCIVLGPNDIIITTTNYNKNNKTFDAIYNTLMESIQTAFKTIIEIIITTILNNNNETFDEINDTLLEPIQITFKTVNNDNIFFFFNDFRF